MIVGVLADTHIPSRAAGVPPVVLKAFAGVDLILHAGDITVLSVLDELRRVAPVVAVYGNVDPPETRLALPGKEIVVVANWRFGLVHGDQGRGPTPLRALHSFEQVHAVVFGHSHQPYLQWHEGVLLFNPGSPTDERRAHRPSFGLLRLDQKIEAEIRYL